MLKEYEAMLPTLRQVARDHGYALGLHGSGTRDLDLIAAPWTEQYSTPAVLVEALRASVDGVIRNDDHTPLDDFLRRNPERKPLGRLAWAIQVGGGRYIDVSVCPAILPMSSEEAALEVGLTAEEREVMDRLVATWNGFMQLERAISLDAQRTFQEAIHAAQQVLAQWALERTFPGYWGQNKR